MNNYNICGFWSVLRGIHCLKCHEKQFTLLCNIIFISIRVLYPIKGYSIPFGQLDPNLHKDRHPVNNTSKMRLTLPPCFCL